MAEKHTKKVVVKDTLSTPEARAERLKRVRNLANLSRKDMCTSDDLNINTYKGWEIARYGGLPLDGAKKVIKRVVNFGVVCNIDWLLYGKGEEPYIIPKSAKNEQKTGNKEVKVDDNILREIMLFQSLFSNTIYYKVSDDGLDPKIKVNDYVAGIRYFDKEINKCIDKDCIIQTKDGRILTRQLKKGKERNTYMLICTNPQTSVEMPVLYDLNLESAAPILRIYKANSKKEN